MLLDSTKRDIEKISKEILLQSKAFDVFPTPIEKIVHHSEFVLGQGIDLSKIESSLFDKVRFESSQKLKTLQSGLSKIKGFFDRTEKTIYVDLKQTPGRQNFVKLHEVGHGILPWQNDVAKAFDNDETLLSNFEDQFEAEANYFASITLFQQDRFLAELNKLPLSLSSGLALSKKFGSSGHSALRNYVIQSKNKCSLLILNPITPGNLNKCKKRNVFYSSPFLEQVGEIKLPNEFDITWPFIKDFMFGKRFNEKGEIKLNTLSEEEITCTYHYFYNTYNVFILFFPKGEANKVKTKIILLNQ